MTVKQKKLALILGTLLLGIGLLIAAGLWVRDAPERRAREQTAHEVSSAKALVRRRLPNPETATFWNVRAGYGEVCGYVRTKDTAGRETPYTHFRVVEGRAELRSDFETQPIEVFDRWDKALTSCILMGEAIPDDE